MTSRPTAPLSSWRCGRSTTSCRTSPDSSLIIIDELGRGTSEEEGSAMCVAITEKLINSDAFVIVATHFDLMTQLESMYPNVIKQVPPFL
ncbi:hypothetical protein MTO96_014793 [Rhipicephalus appendiculatus]